MEAIRSFYSKSELAKKLGVSNRTVDNWMANGKISFTKVGRRVIFSENDMIQLIENNHREAFYYDDDYGPADLHSGPYGKLNSESTGWKSHNDKHVKNQS